MLSISQQCRILNIPRSSYYHNMLQENAENEHLMRLIDEEYSRHPFFGYRKMRAWLVSRGHKVNGKRVLRLMQKMGIHAIYQSKKTTIPHPDHKKYPYLLRDVKIDRINQVWSTDITYIRLEKGFVYLTAVIDWYSRKVLSWRLSNTMESRFCIEALQEALQNYDKPEIFNTDQGVQFTSMDFVQILKDHKIRISMDSKGRALDNIFVERLWRSVKYEEVYLKEYKDVWDAEENLKNYFSFYNQERFHQALDYLTPDQVYFGSIDKIGKMA